MNRYNVIMIIFDLHSVTAAERREYRLFRKHLLRSGYIFVQESVYVKLLKNSSCCQSEVKDIQSVSPVDSNVIAVPMSLENFKRIYTVSGDKFDFSGFSDSVVVF